VTVVVVSRFAPAPTGFLHLGHVLNAIYVWGLARSRGGRVLLRIEDHDRQRSRPEFEQAILEDLDWLGFTPDEPSTDGFRAGPCRGRQSDRHAIYETALSRLRDMGLVYACECSRKDMNAAGETATGDELRYPGTCASKNLPERLGLGLRVRLEPSIERFTDLRHGPQEQSPAEQCGDLLLRDREGNWTYQFAVTVDDFEQGVTLVIRGDDLLPSTGRQIQLARLLGRDTTPQFLHHPLIMKTTAQKLSKSDGDTGVRDLRAKGWTADAVIGEAAYLGGLLRERHPVTAKAVAAFASTDGRMERRDR
jgi:glutamyl-tRNA synthetase/glutamyl-Q tRNA(Asp) synthetase